MSQGLFELRKDAITSWWVATMIDRTFARERFALPAAQIADRGDCFNCRIPPGDGIRLRVLKDFAFTVAGTEEEARAREGTVAQVSIADARAAGSWRTVVAPPGEHRPIQTVGSELLTSRGSTVKAPNRTASPSRQCRMSKMSAKSSSSPPARPWARRPSCSPSSSARALARSAS